MMSRCRTAALPSGPTDGAGPSHAVCITASTICQLGDPFPAVGVERIRTQRCLARAPRCPSRTSTAGMCATEVLFHMRGERLGCVGFMQSLAPQALCCVAA